MLASVVEQASLSLTWTETTEDMFSHGEAQVKDSTLMKQDEKRKLNTETLEQQKQKPNTRLPVGPNKDRASSSILLKWRL